MPKNKHCAPCICKKRLQYLEVFNSFPLEKMSSIYLALAAAPWLLQLQTPLVDERGRAQRQHGVVDAQRLRWRGGAQGAQQLGHTATLFTAAPSRLITYYLCKRCAHCSTALSTFRDASAASDMDSANGVRRSSPTNWASWEWVRLEKMT